MFLANTRVLIRICKMVKIIFHAYKRAINLTIKKSLRKIFEKKYNLYFIVFINVNIYFIISLYWRTNLTISRSWSHKTYKNMKKLKILIKMSTRSYWGRKELWIYLQSKTNHGTEWHVRLHKIKREISIKLSLCGVDKSLDKDRN